MNIKNIHKTPLVVNVFQDRYPGFDHKPYRAKMDAGLISRAQTASGHADRPKQRLLSRGDDKSRAAAGNSAGWEVEMSEDRKRAYKI